MSLNVGPQRPTRVTARANRVGPDEMRPCQLGEEAMVAEGSLGQGATASQPARTADGWAR